KKDEDIPNNRGINYTLLVDGRTAQTVTYDADPNAATITTTYTYAKWDSYQQDSITVSGIANGVKGWKNGVSTFTFDTNGHVKQLFDHQEDRYIKYVQNQNGQTLKRLEYDANNPLKAQVIRQFYYFDGKAIGDQGTDKVASR